MKKEQTLLFAIHPVLTDLKINENGTVIFWKGKKLNILTYKRKRDNYPQYIVNFKGRTHRVTKLVCEAWHGMRKADEVVRRKDGFTENHFTNLYWGKRGGVMHKNLEAKRCKSSKITKADEPVILKRIAKGETLISIAIDYNTTGMSIYRVKKRHSA